MTDTAKLFSDESIWQLTFDAVPDLIFVLDNEHRIVRANRAAAERLGCPAEELVGQFCDVVMRGTDSPPDSCPHRLVLQDGQARTVEIPGPRTGESFAVYVTPLTDGQGQTIGAVHVAREISQLKRIEEERGERARFESLLADISARFVGIAAERVMDEIATALEQVREFFGLDRLGLRHYRQDSVSPVHPTFVVCADGLKPIDPTLDLGALFPWCYAQLATGEPVVLVRDQLPPAAAADRLAMERLGIQSAAVIPISLGGCPRYLLVPSTAGQPRSWPPDLLRRMKLLGEIFVQALTHRQADVELTEAELK